MDSKVKYGQEIGPNLIKLGKHLIHNERLCMLLENTDLDPTNKLKHPEPVDGLSLFKKNLIRFIPILTGNEKEQGVESKLVIICDSGNVTTNLDNENLSVLIYVYSPFEQWQITGDNLRPFAIMSEIRKSLQDKRINGLGEIKYDGFHLSLLTEEMATYVMRFTINAFS